MRNHSEELNQRCAWRSSVVRDSYFMPLRERAYKWRDGDDTGRSAMTVWLAMMGFPSGAEHPYDTSDLGRILRLLELIPEWKPRVGELARISPTWAALVDRWDQLVSLMESETGFFGEHGNRAPKTYRLITEIRDAARKAA